MIDGNIWRKKYKGADDKTPEDTFRRVAKYAAGGEKDPLWEDKFFLAMAEEKFVPGGRILAAAGTDKPKATLSNCFGMPPVPDMMSGIMDALKEGALTMQAGGGIGMNFSKIRPYGAPVGGTGSIASGPVSFMHEWNSMSMTISGVGDRKGAMMAVLNCDHPDIIAFISAKANNAEGNKVLEKFNLSVGITRSFIEAVKSDADWDLQFGGKVYKTMKAKHLWDIIMENAHKKAEPGVLFLDTINEWNPYWYGETIDTTNPCVTGDTLVATPTGYKRADSFKEGDDICTVCGVGKVEKVEVYHNMPIYRVEFSDGGALYATAAHQFHAMKARGKETATKKYTLLRLDQLNVGDWVRVCQTAPPQNPLRLKTYGLSDWEYGFLIGVVIGDGSVSHAMLEKHVMKVTTHYDEKAWNDILKALLSKVRLVSKLEKGKDMYDKSGTFRISGKNKVIFKMLEEVGLVGTSKTKRIPALLMNTNENVLKGILDGIFSTDGNFNNTSNHPVLRFSSANSDLVSDVRNILLMFGIHCAVSKSTKNRDSMIGDRKIKGGPIHALSISGASVKTFYDKVGITHPDKKLRLFNGVRDWALTGNTWKARITSITPAGHATVYDLFEPTTDTWITNGYVSRGCGEQPLGPYGSCNLGAINLTKFVSNPFKDNAVFDHDGFAQTIEVAIRFLDNILDVNYYPLEAQKKYALGTRKIGLGIIGLGSALAMLRIRYGSDKSVDATEKIMHMLRSAAYNYSNELAAEKGVFPFFDKEKHLSGKFVQTLPDFIKERIAGMGIRNAALLTIAPTGSTAQLVGSVSSGVEPIFDVDFDRNNYGEGFSVVEPTFKLYCDLFGRPKENPDFFAGAHDITPVEHLKVMAACQKYIDASISKTINLPGEITVKEMEDVYFKAFEMGCKGCTVYREGSLDNEILKKKDAKKQVLAKGRPYTLDGKTYKVKIPDTKHAYYLTFTHTVNGNGDGKKPIELFINTKDPSVEEWTKAFGRLVSAVFRNSEDPSFLVEEFKQVYAQSGFFSAERRKYIPSLIAEFGHVMQDYFAHIGVSDPQVPIELYAEEVNRRNGGKKPNLAYCKKCGKNAVVVQEGCARCLACHDSKCG